MATSYKPLLKLRKPLVFRWWWRPAMMVRLAAASTPLAMVPKPDRRHGMLHPTRSGRWLMAPIPLLALAAVALLPSMAVTVRSRISLLPARAFAHVGTVRTATMQRFRAHPWRLRTLPELLRCYGRPFPVSGIKSRRVAMLWTTPQCLFRPPYAARRDHQTMSTGGAGLILRRLWARRRQRQLSRRLPSQALLRVGGLHQHPRRLRRLHRQRPPLLLHRHLLRVSRQGLQPQRLRQRLRLRLLPELRQGRVRLRIPGRHRHKILTSQS